MRLPTFTNVTTTATLKGVLENSGSYYLHHPLTIKSRERLSQPGDVIRCDASGDLYVVSYQDLSSLGARAAFRHYYDFLLEIHGTASIRRMSGSTDTFGRSVAASQQVVEGARTTLPFSNITYTEPSPAHGTETIIEYRFLILTSEEVRPADLLTYSNDNGVQSAEWRVLSSKYIAPTLQEVVCRR